MTWSKAVRAMMSCSAATATITCGAALGTTRSTVKRAMIFWWGARVSTRCRGAKMKTLIFSIPVSGMINSHTVYIQDTGGSDTYRFSLAGTDVAATDRGFNIFDDQGDFDHVIVEQIAAGHPLYLNTDQVTNRRERIDFTGIEQVTITGQGAALTGGHALAPDAAVTNHGDMVSVTTTAASGTTNLSDTGLWIIASSIDLQCDIGSAYLVLDAGEDLTLARDLTAAGELVLRSATGAIATGDTTVIAAGLLEAEARIGIALNTRVDQVNARNLGTGDIRIDEFDDLVLLDLVATDGAVNVTSGGTLAAMSVASLNDVESNDVILTATGGDVLVDLIKVGLFHGVVTIAAAGDVRELDPQDNAFDVFGNDASLSAHGNSIPVDSTDLEIKLIKSAHPDDLILIVDGDIDLNDVDNPVAGSVFVAATGTITVTHLTSGAGNIYLVSLEGDILVDYINAGTGEITLLAENGKILEGAQIDPDEDLIGGTAVLTAGYGIGDDTGSEHYIETALDRLQAQTSTGPILISETDDLELSNIAAAAQIDILSGGNLQTMADAVIEGQRIRMQAGAINIEKSDLRAAEEITLISSGGVISSSSEALIETQLLDVEAQAGVALNTRIGVLAARNFGSGDIRIVESDAIELIYLSTANGKIEVTAGGAITATRVDVSTDAPGNDIFLTAAAGDINVGLLAVGSTHGRMYLDARQGYIRDADSPGADNLDATGSFGRFKSLHTVGMTDPSLILELNLAVVRFATEDLDVDLAGDVELNLEVEGNARVKTTGSITVTYLTVTDGSVILDAGTDILIDYLDAGVDVTVELTAGGSVMEVAGFDADVDLVAAAAVLTAGSGIGLPPDRILETSLGTLRANSTDGPILISETDDIELTGLTSEGGAIQVVSGGTITATEHITTADEVYFEAANSVSTGTSATITASRLEVVAGAAIDLIAWVDETSLTILGAGDLRIVGNFGNVDLNADGSLTATVGAKEIIAQAEGPMTLLTSPIVDENPIDVRLEAAGDLDATVVANELFARAGGSMTLATTVVRMDAETSQSGELSVAETDDIDLLNVSSFDGPIDIEAGGALTATLIQSLTDAEANDIRLAAAAGNLAVTQLISGPMSEVTLKSAGDLEAAVTATSLVVHALGDASLNAAGTLEAAVTATSLVVRAAGTMMLTTTVARLDAETSAVGSLTVDETDHIDLVNVQCFDGSIAVSAGGNITALYVIGHTADVTLSTTDGILVAGTVFSANRITMNAGERDADGNFLYTVDDQGRVRGTITISDFSRMEAAGASLPAGEAGIVLAAAGEVVVYSTPEDDVGSEHTTIEVDVDQIGWYDPATGNVYEAGDPGTPFVVYSDAVGGFVLADSNLSLKKLFEVAYKPGSGRVHTVKNEVNLVIVRQTPQLTELILNDEIKPSIPPSPYPGFVYIDKVDFESYSDQLEEYEYVPDWSSGTDWEIIHVSEFMSAAYDALAPDDRPDFWVRIQVGGKDDIAEGVYIGEDAVTYEDIGETRLSTEVIFHQIGWYNPATGEGRLDPRAQLVNADDGRANNFQTGVKWPGAGWEPWYVYEYVSGERQVVLADGRVYAYTDAFDGSDADDNGIPDWVYAQRPTPGDPEGQLNPNLETHLIEGSYVLLPVSVTNGSAHEDLDSSASEWLEDLYGYNWNTGGYAFTQNPAVDYDGDGNSATKLIPVNHYRVADVRTEFKVRAQDYTYTGRDYLSNFWTAWYAYDWYGAFQTGNWYSHYNIYGYGSGDPSYYCADAQGQHYGLYWQTRYLFYSYSAVYAHFGAWRDHYSTWDHVAWNAGNSQRLWDQVAVDTHWQYRGHLQDNGYVVQQSGDWNDYWVQVLQWSNTVAGVPWNNTPPDYSNESYPGRPTSDYYRVDEFEDRYHYRYGLTYNRHGIRDLREHYDYQVISKTRPVSENPSVITATLQVRKCGDQRGGCRHSERGHHTGWRYFCPNAEWPYSDRSCGSGWGKWQYRSEADQRVHSRSRASGRRRRRGWSLLFLQCPGL